MDDPPGNGAQARQLGGWPPAIRWLVGSAGLTGVLVLIGYISQTAYYSFLGVTMPAVTVTACIAQAGNLVVDLIGILFLWVNDHPLYTVLILVGAAVLLSAQRLKGLGRTTGGRWRVRVPSFSPSGAAVLLVLVALVKTIGFDLPVLAMNDLLHQRVIRFDAVFPGSARIDHQQPGESAVTTFLRAHFSPVRLITWREQQTWLDTLCARAPEVDPTGCVPADSKGRSWQEAWSWHTQNAFLFNFALMAIVLALASWFFSRAPDTGERYVALRWVIILLVAINLVALPSVYARTIRGTTFRNAELMIQNPAATGGSASQRAGAASAPAGKTGPELAGNRAAAPATPVCDVSLPTADCNFFILDDTGDQFTLLELNSLEVWYVPRSNVSVVKVNALEDLLTYYFDSRGGPAAQPGS